MSGLNLQTERAFRFPTGCFFAESNAAEPPPRKVGQPELPLPLSKNLLHPSEAKSQMKRPTQLPRTSAGRKHRSSRGRLSHPLAAPGGGRRSPGRDVTAPGRRRGGGGGGAWAGPEARTPRQGGGAGRTRPFSRDFPRSWAPLPAPSRFSPGLHFSLWLRVLGR
jgi:hypothetical protein